MKLRLPDGMRERIAEAAKANGRSMNAEIVQRLEQSFEGTTRSLGDDSTLYVLLDTNDLPGSWAEFNQHLDQIERETRQSFHTMTVNIVTPELISSSIREDQASKLAMDYAKLRRETRKAKRQ